MTTALKEITSYNERTSRACDALLLAYSPKQPLARAFSRNFYIPSTTRIEEALGFTLKTICGIKSGSNAEWDNVKWGQIKNPEKIPSRVFDSFREVIVSGSREEQSILAMSLGVLAFGEVMEQHFVPGKGDLYRFIEGKREEALELFESYWTRREKSSLKKIHEGMRNYTAQQFAGRF
jgi:hypothetical protein